MLFDLPAAEQRALRWPWYSTGAALEVKTSGKKYFLSFIPRAATGEQWREGLRAGREWRAVIEGRPERSREGWGLRITSGLVEFGKWFGVICALLVGVGQAADPGTSVVGRWIGGAMAVGMGAFLVLLIVERYTRWNQR